VSLLLVTYLIFRIQKPTTMALPVLSYAHNHPKTLNRLSRHLSHEDFHVFLLYVCAVSITLCSHTRFREQNQTLCLVLQIV
jgi:hypothetical protein